MAPRTAIAPHPRAGCRQPKPVSLGTIWSFRIGRGFGGNSWRLQVSNGVNCSSFPAILGALNKQAPARVPKADGILIDEKLREDFTPIDPLRCGYCWSRELPVRRLCVGWVPRKDSRERFLEPRDARRNSSSFACLTKPAGQFHG